MQPINKYLSPQVIESIRTTIADADGNEVFFVGYTDEQQCIEKVDVVARGDEESVPAILQVAEEADAVIHNHPSGPLKPSKADLNIASLLDRFSVAFYIINNDASEIYVVVEPFAKQEILPLQVDHIAAILKPGGPISKKLKGYEDRPQQVEMITDVCRAFNQKKVSAIEAGTGTGKTLAYLLPAIYWSLQNKERVVVSTNTINLQEQLIKKDIPFLQSVLKEKFEAVLVKGRGNYVCLRKVQELESEFDLLTEEHERDELKHLIAWAKSSKDGSKADLAQIPNPQVWEKLASESETCTRIKCKSFRQCFVNKARRKASQANILVVNHHLLFADLAIRSQIGSSAVLPPYQRVIFDEAHHLEDVASSYFGSRITRGGITRILHRLHRKHKMIYKGLIHAMRAKLVRKQRLISDDVYQNLDKQLSMELPMDVDFLVEMNSQTMERIYFWAREQSGQEKGEVKIRLTAPVRDRLLGVFGLEEQLKEFIGSLRSLAAKLNRLIGLIQQAESDAEEDWSSPIIELLAQAARLMTVADTIEHVLFKEDQEFIKWIEIKEGYRSADIVRLQSSPLEIGHMMNTNVYQVFDTVIMTSATLTIENSFDFLGQRIGLNLLANERFTKLVLPAPFDYEKQAIIGIPLDVPDPRHENFANELGKFVFKSLTLSDGRAFVLFTSYGLLNMLYNQLAESLQILGIMTLKQGTENRQRLLEHFRRDKTSVLFGTDSFWEGVDVEGDALESVIITKLPFRVPSEPIIEARVEAIERRGGNAFMEYSVPLAVLKLKQGFGRLIRKKTDRGCILIFDKRVVEKSYGRVFLHSLPKCHLVTGKREKVFAELKAFFA